MATQTLRRPEPPSRATLRKQRLLEMENEQRIEDAEALKMTEEQRLSLFHSFRSVKFEWSDLDGMRSVRRRYNSPPVTEVQCHPSSPPSHPSHPHPQSPRAAAHIHSQTHSHSPSHIHNSPSHNSPRTQTTHAQGQQPRPPQLQLTPPPVTPAFAVLTNAHFDSFGPGSDETIRGISPLSGVATPFPSSPVSAFPPTPLHSASIPSAFPPTPVYSSSSPTSASAATLIYGASPIRAKSTSPTSSAGRITKTRSKKAGMGKVGKTRSPVKGLFPPGLGSPTSSAPASALIYATPLPPLITGASTSALSCGHAGASVVVSPIRVPLPPFLSSDTSHSDPADEDEDAWEDLEGEEDDADDDEDGDGEEDEDALPTPVARGWGFEERLDVGLGVPTLSYGSGPMRAGTPTPYSVPSYTVSAHGANEEEQVGGKRKR